MEKVYLDTQGAIFKVTYYKEVMFIILKTPPNCL